MKFKFGRTPSKKKSKVFAKGKEKQKTRYRYLVLRKTSRRVSSHGTREEAIIKANKLNETRPGDYSVKTEKLPIRKWL